MEPLKKMLAKMLVHPMQWVAGASKGNRWSIATS
jgi:hypothetical protein